ncbi:MAG: DUF1476 domain-containing protein [Proteobacteria bacterium]|nr:DUF1476 domain-containing protein [Pseudomonadota bacterium]
MSHLENRETAFENKYAHDQDMLFRIESRASRLLGLWAAQEMGLTGEEADNYAGTVVSSNLKEAGTGDVIAKVTGDLVAKGKATDTVSSMMVKFMKEAEIQIKAA